MSKQWFECTVKYRGTDANGVQKIVSENFLVDALTFTEAEANITKNMTEYISEEFKIVNIKRTNYSEVHYFEDCDKWFKAKVALLAYDEESGKERVANIYLLVEANDAKEAFNNVAAVMKSTLGDYSIPSISETKTVAVFEYKSEEN